MFVVVGKNIHFSMGRLFGFTDFEGSIFEFFNKKPKSVRTFFGINYISLVDDFLGGFIKCLPDFQI
jgi:hypothetical protein